MDAKPSAPPEAVLIRRARLALGLSPEKIVKEMDRGRIGSRWWRQIEDGKTAPDDTLAHMAYVVGVAPDQLVEVGRPESAEILRQIMREAPAELALAAPPADAEFEDPIEQEIWEMRTLTSAQKADHIATVRVKRVVADLRREIEDLRAQLSQEQQRNAQ